MPKYKWDKLPYILKTATGTRSLLLLSNFQAVSDGWFDTGEYTVTETGLTLGKMSVDLHMGGPVDWSGNTNEFTQEQFGELVYYIACHNVPENSLLQDSETKDTQLHLDRSYQLLSSENASNSILLQVKHHNDRIDVRIDIERDRYLIWIGGEPFALVLKEEDDWVAITKPLDEELLNFVIEYLDNYNL